MNIKLFIIFLLAAVVVTAASLIGYRVATTMAAKKQTEAQQTKTLPFTNPFVQKPSSSFTTTPAFENPFATTPTSAYQNPFATTNSGNQPYTNPFEQLR